jgi:hypothetical protein
MNYSQSMKKIQLGDLVRIDFDTVGTVVCDFDSWTCLEGYDYWLVKDELVGGGYLTGVMIKTEELGFLHCADGAVNIQPE